MGRVFSQPYHRHGFLVLACVWGFRVQLGPTTKPLVREWHDVGIYVLE